MPLYLIIYMMSYVICYDKPSKSIPGQVNLLSQIGGLNYWFIHPYKKLSQIGGLFSWDLFIWMNKPVI